MIVPASRTQPLRIEPGQKWLPFGNGRSYGDSCLNDGGALVHTRSWDHYLAFDRDTGILHCEAGVQLGAIIDLVLAQGWFLPVTPGTQFVTVGGAIANDVHGKNHHRAGSFGDHVLEFEMLRSDGARPVCSPHENVELFDATIGGLGLTGLITRAVLQLRRVPGPWLDSESMGFATLAEFFELSSASESSHEYTVAWIDCAPGRRSTGRGIFSRANHARPADVMAEPRRSRRMVPLTPPVSLVNSTSVRVFNWAYWLRHRKKRRLTSHFRPFFYPLDELLHWNRIYGPSGFLQYQCVVPPGRAPEAMKELMDRIGASGMGSFLAVLKQFGEKAPRGLMSFPRPGTTLAVDFPIDRQGKVFALLDALDEVVCAAGGAVYPAKDARMSGQAFRQYFPAWEHFQAFLDPQISSGFWRRMMES